MTLVALYISEDVVERRPVAFQHLNEGVPLYAQDARDAALSVPVQAFHRDVAQGSDKPPGADREGGPATIDQAMHLLFFRVSRNTGRRQPPPAARTAMSRSGGVTVLTEDSSRRLPGKGGDGEPAH